jgi:hypothetical protein
MKDIAQNNHFPVPYLEKISGVYVLVKRTGRYKTTRITVKITVKITVAVFHKENINAQIPHRAGQAGTAGYKKLALRCKCSSISGI